MSRNRSGHVRLEFLYGRHAVLEALRAERRGVYKILAAEGASDKGTMADILTLAKERGITVSRVPRQKLDERSRDHHGVAASVSAYPYVSVDEILAKSASSGEKPFLLALDQIQDPQNLGALLRTAEAAGVQGVFMPDRHSVMVTETVVRASAGASEHLWIALGNLAQIIDQLKGRDIWSAGLDAGADSEPIESMDLDRPLLLVVGSEGRGMRRLVRESCDFLVRLPMKGKVSSLNASAAGAIAMYAAAMARMK